ncbi:hypothetical protein HMPREF2526_06185 [Corynebacterium sp. HMSC070E08]|uniref:hypothetical protein n=1 Tax=Corynebacterium sp. HMSC070E08 TaxID=1715006 RepID=UPI0008A191B0|nr:hypothetical protein [Corynebacterium sp. HMSC070E08]OFN80073.1 hypothetical protein HMPREF2526_06185 [Corynebacterium sp. HMSC070E08]
MTDLSTSNIQRLLAETTPGPWERHPDNPRMLCNLERKFAVHAELTKGKGTAPQPEDVANTELIALAPPLAQEVLRMREALRDLSVVWVGVSIDPTRTPAEQQLAAAVVNHIDRILGGHDG